MKKKLALYIYEFDRSDHLVEANWFVGFDSKNYDDWIKQARQNLADELDETVESMRKTIKIINVYKVSENIIKEVARSIE